MSDLHVIVGLGATGLSCARYLKNHHIPFEITDTRLNPPNLAIFQKMYPDVPVALGGLDAQLLKEAATIVLSPGIALHDPSIAAQVKRGVLIVGDIELFARTVKVPVISITGTNAKSTVTTLVGKMAEASGYHVAVGGNLGTPVLDLLEENTKTQAPEKNLFVLELSSFQLETTYSLRSRVATILNITPDHMDRYHDLAAYQAAKHRVYQHCDIAVCNRDDVLTVCHQAVSSQLYFTLNAPKKNEFGLKMKGKEVYLAHENTFLLPVNELSILGKQHQMNALAALAIGYGAELPMEIMLNVLREFKGLPHRCQFVREHKNVRWYNDSKGTNVGATLAAIEGLGSEITGKLILIAGGVGKNADFSSLIPVMEKYVRHAILIGESAHDMAALMADRINIFYANSMEEAVQKAAELAEKNDSVLLSPACASFDMFNHFEHRGEVFMEAVRRL